MNRLIAIHLLLAYASFLGAQEPAAKPVLVLDAEGHSDSIPKVLFSPSGKELISISKDKTVRIWDLASGTSVRTFRPPIGPGRAGILYAGAVSSDGRLAIAGIGSKPNETPIFLVSLLSGQIERVLEGHTDIVGGLAFSPDGKYLVSASEDKTGRIWNSATGESIHVLEGHQGTVRRIAVSPDGQKVLTASFDGTARIWSMQTGKSEAVLKAAFKDRYFGVMSVAWSKDGKLIATGGLDWRIRIWGADGSLRETYGPIGDVPQALDFSPDGKEILFSRGMYNRIDCSIIDVARGKERLNFNQHKAYAWDVAISPDGKLAATSGYLGEELFVWKVENGSMVHRLGGNSKAVWSAAWSADSQAIAWGNTGHRGFVNKFHPLERAFHLGDLEWVGLPEKVFRAQSKLGPLSLRYVSGALAVENEGNVVAELRPPEKETLMCFSLLPASKVALGTIYSVSVVEATNGKQVRLFKGHTGNLHAVAPSPNGKYLLTGSADQTLRIWSLEQDEPLMSLFFARDDWIVWTPEGYYAASPGGERLMGWQVNNGPDKMASFYPASQFRKTLYRPDVIKRLLEAGSVAKALELADKERGKTTSLVQVADVLPPLIVVTTPDQSSSTIAEPQLTVRALARSTGKHPLMSLRLLLDGRPFTEKDGLKNIVPPKIGEVRETWILQLAPGKHTIAVQAESAVSKSVSESVEVIFDATRGVKRVDEPKKVDPKELPCLYVLAIGISEYPDKLKLDYAAKDATVLGKTFASSSKSIYQKVEVKIVTDKDATRRGILQGLTWLKKQMTQRDVAIITFAGHGDKDNDGKFYLLPVDVDTEDLLSSAVPSDLFKGALQSIPGRVIVLLDACHSGAVGGDARKRSGGGITDDLRRDLVSDDFGVVVMCSSTGKEYSLESAAVGHGYFTLSIVEGLTGKADYDKDHAVTLNELDLYVSNRVKELSQGRQHPVTDRPTSVRSFPLSTLMD